MTPEKEHSVGRIEAICVSREKGVRKSSVAQVRLLQDFGLEGDAHAGAWHRQVSLLDEADIAGMREQLPRLTFGDFGENLVVSGIALGELGLGSRLRVGPDAELVITQRGKTCHSRCAIYYQTGDCIMPKRGLFARVAKEGAIAVGDDVAVLNSIKRETLQAAVITVSDSCAAGTATDTAGPAVAAMVRERLAAHLYAAEVVPDDEETIAERLEHFCDGPQVDLILVVGGTGFAPRDVTPEAVRRVIQRATPGLDEAMRARSLQITPHAMLSRAVSGIRGTTLIVSLPGSEKAATENLDTILTSLRHGLAKLLGDTTPCGPDRPSGK